MGATQEVRVKIGGEKYALLSDDHYLKKMRFGFDPEIVDLCSVLVKPADRVLDIGANIGCTAILFGQRAERVYAVEASPSTFDLLRRNIERVGMGHIEPVNCAMGAEAGQAVLSFSVDNRSGGVVSDQANPAAGHVAETVAVETADALVQARGISRVDFIKLDVEGFEAKVLQGAQDLLQQHQPITLLELNHWCLNAFQRMSVPDFLDFLRSVFPILLAVDGRNYLDLHSESERYVVMYEHINNFNYPNIVGAFSEGQLAQFFQRYRQGNRPSRFKAAKRLARQILRP